MRVAAYLLSVLAAGVLWVAALAKLTDQRSLIATLRALAIPRAATRVAALLLPTTELLTAVSLMLFPGHMWPSILLASLFVLFAASAGVAMIRGLSVSCSCFGASSSNLGWRQIAMLPVWLLLAGLLVYARESWSSIAGSLAVLAIAMTVLLTRAFFIMHSLLDARGDRRALHESIMQPTSIVAINEGAAA
jgi:hypothetical protein